LKAWLKQIIFGLLGKEPEAIVVSFATGDPDLSAQMFAEIRELAPDRRHVLVYPDEIPIHSAIAAYRSLRKRFEKFRIGLAPVLFTRDPQYRKLRLAAILLAPRKILAYNGRLERHHLRLSAPVASFLFLRGLPLDRIFLRPKWLVPWKRDRSSDSGGIEEFEGRPLGGRPRVAVLSPYFPFPLSHGGAVRIFNLLREMSREFDIFLLAFRDGGQPEEVSALLDFCARVVLVGKPRYREPRWSTILPPEVHEFSSAAMRRALARIKQDYRPDGVQVEYTMLAPYAGDVLVEHDITFELYRQVNERERTISSWWNYWRWRRFEKKWVPRYPRVVAMSKEDRSALGLAHCEVIPNGVDLDRFTPEPETPGRHLLFVGSFRHFPNVVAFRFLLEQVWPRLREQLPELQLTVVGGPDPLLYWREYTRQRSLPEDPQFNILGFVADVRPLYTRANLALVPTLVSAGTNLKVLEAMAMQRAVVSTPSGCQGLDLEHGKNVWIADSADAFAAGIITLLSEADLRLRIAAAGRALVKTHFDWKQIGFRQRAMLRQVLSREHVLIRPATPSDLKEIFAIQATSREAAQWVAEDYLSFDTHIAVRDGKVAGFVVSRKIAAGEREILNVAVEVTARRNGIATALIRAELDRWQGAHYLEVRESNAAARRLYEALGFEQTGTRPEYYENPSETGIVMKRLS